IRGVVLAALVAALMSTLDSVLNGASSLVVNDFIKTRKKQRSEKQLLLISRGMVAVFMVVAGLWAPVILTFEGIVEYFQSFLGYVTMPAVVIFLGGLFWRRATAAAGFWTLVIGAPIGMAGFLAGEIFELYQLQFLYGTGLMLLLCVSIFVGVTLSTEAPKEEELQDYVWSRAAWREESRELAGKPWWQNYRVLAGLLVVVTVVWVGLFI
ncbi:MAG: sodium:solute symporter, partial [Halomonas sp.]|nr:sodium:solute symporter [Halomonas sp.]MDX5502797.1 sodium:solute symporter [Halomonas sp.]